MDSLHQKLDDVVDKIEVRLSNVIYNFNVTCCKFVFLKRPDMANKFVELANPSSCSAYMGIVQVRYIVKLAQLIASKDK